MRVQSGDISDKVFKKLASLYSSSGQHSPSKKLSLTDQPLLIILDRQADLHTMLYHSWTYLSLINDIFSIKNNQFQYTPDSSEASKQQALTYELDFAVDDILRANAFKDFHEAAENVDRAMN